VTGRRDVSVCASQDPAVSTRLAHIWRYNADRRPRIEAERLKYGAQIPVVRLSSDREIEEFVDASSPVA